MQLLFIGDFLSEVFLGIIMVLDTLIYSLISSAYKIFMAIASARLLSSDVYYDIASRIYIVIGVLMLFVLSYAILKAIVDPDQATKGDLGPGMVKRVVIAVIGLAITPVLFNVLYQAQGLFLEQDVLGKVFFRIENTENIEVNGTSGNPDEQIKNIGGAVAATSIWQAFFHPAEGINAADIKSDASEYVGKAVGTAVACGLGIALGVIGVAAHWFTFGLSTVLLGGAAVALCASSIAGDVEQANEIAAQGGEVTLEHAYAVAAGGGGFDIFLIFIDNYIEDDEIEYFWGVSTLCGAFALYAFASFSIDMGVRAAKLAYYQIIAPIPLIMQVLPKYKDTFSKYIKNVVSTFLEVFIRISVVYIVVYVVCHLQDLFSSFGSLWGNESLNLAEKSLALAFLILGLVIFAKSAPDIICQSLNIEKGSMKLGIGKKLADGGAFAAGGVGYGAVTSAVRNWRDDKNKGFWNKARSAAAGFGSGAARAAFNQFGPGPGRKPAMNLHDLKNVGEKAAQGATDKRDRRDERQEEFAAAKQAHAQARAEYDALLNDPTATQAQRDAAKAKMESALKRMNEATAIGSVIDKAEKAFETWSVGTVDLSRENADMKFAGALKKLRDDARGEAYKKSATAKAFKQQMERLQATEISEYREGWDEESFNQAVRDRITSEMTALNSAQRNRATAQTARDAAEAALTAARATNNTAAIVAAQADLTAREADLVTATNLENTAVANLNTARTTAVTDLGKIAKRTEAEVNKARLDLQRDIQQSKELMEAAADAWVAEDFAVNGGSGDVGRIYQEFLNNNVDYISNNSNRAIDPNNQTKTVASMLSEFADVSTNRVDKDSAVKNTTYTMTINGTPTVFTMDPVTKKYSGGGLKDVSVETLFAHVSEQMKGKDDTKFEANTASTRATKSAKDAVENIPVSDSYRDKVRRKRQAEEGKK